MSVYEQIEVLVEIARRIREAPAKYGNDPLLLDPGTVPGRLLLQAMEHGFLAEAEFIELRVLIEASQQGDFRYQLVQKIKPVADINPPRPWHAFRSAGIWLLREAGIPDEEFSLRWIEQACELIARQIDRRAAKIREEESNADPIRYLERALYRMVMAMLDFINSKSAVQIATQLQKADELTAAMADVRARSSAIMRAAAIVKAAIHGVDPLVYKALECEPGVWSRRLAENVSNAESLLIVSGSDPEPARLSESWQTLNRCRKQLEAIRTTGGSQMAEQQLPAHPNDCTLRVTDVAKIVGLNSGEVSKMCDDKKLAFNGLSGHERRISKSSVIDLQLTLVADGMSKVVQKKRRKP